MRAVLLSFFAIIVLSLAGYTLYHFQTVAACNFTSPGYSYGCSYFVNNPYGRADCNVLPDPTNPCYNPNNSTSSALRKVTNADNKDSTGLEYLIGQDLYSSDFQTRLGAALIVDYMLGQGTYSSGGSANTDESNGIYYAQTNLSTWKQLVDTYAHSADTAQYGIDWNYAPSESTFCAGQTYTVTTAYGPIYTDAYSAKYRIAKNRVGVDDMFYNYFCSNVYTDSMKPSGTVIPEIRFYWNGGKNGLEIARVCGNLQHALGVPPQKDNLPTGQATLSCGPSSGVQTLSNVSITDKDAPTTGYLAVSGSTWTYNVSSGNTYTIQIPTSVAPPFSQVTLYLHAYDSGPLGAGKDTVVWQSGSIVPCASLSCGLTVSPTAIDPYMRFSITLTVMSSVSQTPSGSASLQVAPSIPGGNATQSFVGSSSSSSAVVTFANLGPTAAAGQYSMTGAVTAGGLSASCSGKIDVVYLPYLNVYGGDVMAGAAPAAGGACSGNSAAGVYSWNQYGSGYAGAGSEYAVQALAQIEEFGSGMNPSSSNPPTDLSFANSAIAVGKVNPTQGLFGGFFGDSSGAWACGVDYTKGLGSPISGAAATTQIANIPPTPGAAVINDGTQTRVYANGDVYISRDITYQPGAWPKVDQIPLFELVVTGGNIYIDSSVTQLDGIYIAEPSGATGGKIIDCATNAGGIWKQVDPTVNNFYSTCNKKLTINGVFVAEQALFGRTNGSLGQAAVGDSLSSNHDAEVFNYTPEIWLPRSATTPTDTYDAITALPPIL